MTTKLSLDAARAALLAGVFALAAWGCGSGNSGFGSDGGANGADGTLGLDAHSHPLRGADAPITLGGESSTTHPSITIQPANPTLTVVSPGPPATEQFHAYITGSSTPTPATWSVDLPQIGTINGQGLFTATGTQGGIVTVTAQSPSATATTTLTVKLVLTENPGMLTATQQGQLTSSKPVAEGGTSADPAFRWLYPYDKTIFPRGLTAPVLQFAGTSITAAYVKITSTTVQYGGFFSTTTGQATPSAAAWTAITESATGSTPVTVALTELSGANAVGPITETWTIAQGSLKGTVYYNSYDSALGGGQGTVLKMKPGTPASVLVGGSSGCQVCHSVSGDGSTLTDSNGDYTSGNSYALAAGGATMEVAQADSSFSFTGLYPDGSLVMTNAEVSGSWPPNVPGVSGSGRASQLMNPKTGGIIAAPGFDGVVTNALMPTFSPDGTKIVFNHYDAGQGHSLAVMDFAKATSTFSALTDVVTDPSTYLGWPAFLPDSAEFIFHADSGGDFATWHNQTADVKMVDLKTKTVTALDALNGEANGQVYLPYGAAEAHMNYEPTVLPIAVGGYYWVVFTSRREYGNTITDPDAWETGPARRKKLWVSAIDLAPTPGTDPSHPAFYINDQELQAGNMRGFWVLDPCEANGLGCMSGDECCTGFCRQGSGDGGAQLVCVTPPKGCAQEYEKCTTSSDCCNSSDGYQCINGFCAQPSMSSK